MFRSFVDRPTRRIPPGARGRYRLAAIWNTAFA